MNKIVALTSNEEEPRARSVVSNKTSMVDKTLLQRLFFVLFRGEDAFHLCVFDVKGHITLLRGLQRCRHSSNVSLKPCRTSARFLFTRDMYLQYKY